jgi:hypothetical protein
LASACNKDEDFPKVDLGHDYFPLVMGSSITYEVDSIIWNDFFTPVKVDTFSFYIRMLIDSVFIDNQGRKAYYFRKYYKTDTTSWRLVKNYSLVKNEWHVEQREENIPYLKMAFPVNHTNTWDMNAMNSYTATNSYYLDFHIPSTVGGQNFDSTAIIIHQDLESLIGKDYHKEIFAKHLGLIYKEQISIEKSTSGQWLNGFSLKYSYLSHN